MKIFIIFIINFLFYIFFYINLYSQNIIFGDKYSARAVASGNIFTAVSDDSTAIFYNPAGLSQIDNEMFNSMYADLYSLGIIKTYVLSGASRYNENIEFAGGWVYERINLDSEIWSQHRFLYGMSDNIYENISLGLTAKLIYITTDFENYKNIWGYGFNIGLLVNSDNWGINFLYNNNLRIKIALVLKNIYTTIKWNTYYEKLPLNFIIGVNINYKNLLNTQLELESLNRTITTFGIGMGFSIIKFFNLKLEDRYKINDIILRGGIKFENILMSQVTYNTGIGIYIKKYIFDYAISFQNDYFSSTHYFSLSMKR